MRNAQHDTQTAQAQLKLAASLVAVSQDRMVESARNLLTAISLMPELRKPSREACQIYFEALGARFPIYTNMGLLRPDGQALCHVNARVGDLNAADRTYFQKAIRQREFVMGEPIIGRPLGRRGIPFALPVTDGDAIVGVVFASLDLAKVSAELARVELPEGARLQLADRLGSVLVEVPSRPWLPEGRMLANPGVGAAAAQGSSGVGEGADAEGVQRVYAYAPGRRVGGEGFLAIVSVDKELVTGSSVSRLYQELWVLGFSLLAGFLGAWWFGRRAIVKPTRQILGAVRRLEQGRLDIRIPTFGRGQPDELGRIAGAFNLMAESLQVRQNDLQAELARSRNAYSVLDLVINSMHEGLLAVDAAGRVVMYNKAAIRLFPVDGPIPLSSQWPREYGLFHADGHTLYESGDLPLFRAIRGESGSRQPMLVRNARIPEGRLLHCSYQPIRGDNGVSGGLMVFSDVTAINHLQAEQATQLEQLAETQRKLIEAQHLGRIGNWEFDLRGNRVWWSDEVYLLFGVQREDFDRTIEDIYRRIHPDDYQVVKATHDRSIAQGVIMDVEYRVIKPDASVCWMHATGHVRRDEDGAPMVLAGVVQDITERKNAEADLVLLRNAVARLNDIVLISEAGPLEEPGPRIVFANEAFERLLGYSAQEAIGNTPRMLYGPATNQVTLARMRKALALGQGVREELLHYRKDGGHLWLELDIVPLAAEKGGFSHLIAVMRDITARKEAQQVIAQTERERQQFTRMLQRTANAAQCITADQSIGGTMQTVVDQVRDVIGARQAVLSLTAENDWSQVVTALSVDDRYSDYGGMTSMPDGKGIYSLVCETNKPLRLTQEQMQAHPRRSNFGAHANEHLPLSGLLAVPLMDSAGRNVGLMMLSDKSEGEFNERDEYVAVELAQLASIAIDNARLFQEIRELNVGLEARILERTSELAKQEARYRTLVQQAPAVVWNVDADGRTIFLNRAWEELVGQAPEDGMGYRWLERLHPDDRAEVTLNWEKSRDSLQPYSGTRRFKARDGTYHTMSYRAAPALDADGAVLFWVGIDTDITEYKAIEGALRSSNEELEAFSYSVSHDLRSPLAAIGGFSRALSHRLEGSGAALDETTSHYLERIHAGVEKMDQLIAALLLLAKVARAPLSHDAVDLGAMATAIVGELQAQQPQRNVIVTVQDGLWAQGDFRLLQAALENLLGNAWKFTSGRPQAEIEVGQLPGDNVFYVRDNGVGFDMTYGGKLFGAFQRLHTEAEFPGTGIGLATVRRIISRHRGRVWAHSQPGEGATFFFTLSEEGSPVWTPSQQ